MKRLFYFLVFSVVLMMCFSIGKVATEAESDSLHRGVLLHFEKYPSPEQLQELENLGAEIAKHSWIPESLPDYTGFLYARLPLGKADLIAELDYVKRMTDGETIGTQVPELKEMLAEVERLNPYKHPYMDAILLQLRAVERERSSKHAANWATNRGLRVYENRVNVEIISNTDQPMPADEVAAMGGVIECTWRGQHSAWLPIDRLLSIADQLDGSYYIRRPNEPDMDVGSVHSEAPDSVLANLYHAEGFDGSGVTIGIIDYGFSGWNAAVVAGDLPAISDTIYWSVAGSTFSDPMFGDHGTNCAEVLYDMAPGATYRAYRVLNLTHLGAAVEDGFNNWVDIFSHSLAWFNTGWHDDTGPACDAANGASAFGALFVTAAGNYAQGHWQGEFDDGATINGFHEWAPGVEYNRIPGIPNGGTFIVRLQWNTDGAGPDNYDLLGYKVIGGAPDYSSCSAGENFEAIGGTNTTGADLDIWFRVEKKEGVVDAEFEVFCNRDCDHFTSPNSTHSPSNATEPGVVPVAAVTVSDFRLIWDGSHNPNIASYSSRGPTNDGFPALGITGPTDCRTRARPGGFGGTSCATPNVAGAAACLWSMRPAWGAGQVLFYLYQWALRWRDWGVGGYGDGYDNTFGWGGLVLRIPPTPVVLASFTAIGDQGYITLNWTTASEINCHTWEVHRCDREDGEYSRIGELPGHGSTETEHTYRWIDRQVSPEVTYYYKLKQVDFDGSESWSSVVSAAASAAVPKTYALHQNYPNPFNPATDISYAIPKDGHVTLKVYNVLGAEVATLVDEDQLANFYSVSWNADGLASGVYFCTLKAGEFEKTIKMTFLK